MCVYKILIIWEKFVWMSGWEREWCAKLIGIFAIIFDLFDRCMDEFLMEEG